MPGMGFGFGFGFHRRASGSGNPAFVTAFNTDSGVEPTLVLDYENDSYWEDVDGTDTFANLHTFTRASEATYRDSNGDRQTAAVDEKRLDHDAAGNALGILIEEARTNDFLNSDSPATQTISLGTGDHTLWIEGTGSAAVAANTATGTGFGTATEGSPVTFNISGAGTVDVTISGTVDICQLEAGSFPTSYIPTAGSSVTRAADVPDVATSAFGFNAGAGTWLATASTPGDGDNAFVAEINDGGATNRHYMRHVSSVPRFEYAVLNATGNNGAFNTSYTFNSDQVYKSAMAYDTDDLVGYLDGSQVGTDATVDPPSGLTTINLGNARGGNYLNGHIRAFVYYDERLSNADLASLTS